MKLKITADEFAILLREFRYVKTRMSAPTVETESDYATFVSRKWGSLPPDIELDADGHPVVKTQGVPPDFSGVVAGD